MKIDLFELILTVFLAGLGAVVLYNVIIPVETRDITVSAFVAVLFGIRFKYIFKHK